MMENKITNIEECTMRNCAYNKTERCRAHAVTIGGPHQMCDTFIDMKGKAAKNYALGVVGACKVPDCVFNNSLLCSAVTIKVGLHVEHPDCLNYSAK